MAAKYYKRGVREFFQVTPERVIRVINKMAGSYITIVHSNLVDDFQVNGASLQFLTEESLEGTEITREEFAKEFAIASKLIVLDPV
jgi:hypothetical protein